MDSEATEIPTLLVKSILRQKEKEKRKHISIENFEFL